MLIRVGHERLARQPGMQPLRRELLEKALAFYQRFSEDRDTDAAVLSEKGRAYQRVGEIREMLGQHGPAEKAYRAAADLFAGLEKQAPEEPRHRQDLASTYNDLGILLQATRRLDEAKNVYRDALLLEQKLVADFAHE